ncbi:MAG: flagellar motor protein MotA [Geminicoccaceae bacterium]
MTKPQRYIIRVVLFLVLAVVVVGALYDIILRAFMQNPGLNGLILGVLLLGIVYALRRIWSLRPEVAWIEAFRTSGPGFSMASPPRLLAPVAGALGEEERRGRASLNALSMRYLLDSISARLDESRDITRYQTGLLIFLGLLGTFWGLLETITSVGRVIGELSLTGDDMLGVFDGLKAGLAAPLHGMGTAFSSSLFGLAGSLVLGFIDLQATQAQNSFYNDLEEWLAGLTRHSSAGNALGELGGGAPMPAYMEALLQQTAENVDQLRLALDRSEQGRTELNELLAVLNDRLGMLGERLRHDQDGLARLLGQQQSAQAALGRGGAGLLDEATREHIRNTDQKLGLLIDELARGREETTRELKNEIKLVSRTIAIAAGEPQSLRS